MPGSTLRPVDERRSAIANEKLPRAAREELSGDLRRMVRLHEVSAALAESDDVPAMLDQILRAAIEVTGADMGNVQLLQEPAGVLTIAAHQGFERRFWSSFVRCGHTPTVSPGGRSTRASGWWSKTCAPALSSPIRLHWPCC